jgi:hypothetical protein
MKTEKWRKKKKNVVVAVVVTLSVLKVANEHIVNEKSFFEAEGGFEKRLNLLLGFRSSDFGGHARFGGAEEHVIEQETVIRLQLSHAFLSFLL